MTKYLYSNIIGSFVFDDAYNLIDYIEFNKEDILANALLLEQGEGLETENILLKKHTDAIRIIPLKKAKESINKEKLDLALSFFKKKEYYQKFRKALIILTKKKIKESVKKDTLIVQVSSELDELDKVSNLLSKRLREWYGYYNPEFCLSIDNNEAFVRIILEKSKPELQKELGILNTESMGADLAEKDVDAMLLLARKLKNIYDLRDAHKAYQEHLMQEVCSNLNDICGPSIGAKLVTIAGSLKKLAEFPASTVQLLGAEKALFRHMKTGARSPKHGILVSHPLVSSNIDKGKAARMLADKISIAVRVDVFGTDKNVGKTLREMLEKRLKQ